MLRAALSDAPASHYLGKPGSNSASLFQSTVTPEGFKAAVPASVAKLLLYGGCRNHLGHLASDFLVSLALVMLHALILMCQGMAFSVAMNSKRNHALVALIIATNFVEIKGEALRKFNS